MKAARLTTLGILLLLSTILWAETISYNLYLGVGPMSISAGTASLTQSDANYMGHSATHSVLAMATGKTADRIFELRDTIESYYSRKGESLFYRKRVNEGNKHNLEEAVFEIEDGHYIANLTTRNSISGELTGKSREWRDERIYDMLSMLDFARSIDMDGKQAGYSCTLPMVNGDMVVQQYLIYEGNKQVRADDGKRHDCLVISVRDWKYGKERETLKTYVTADDRHIPVQLEINIGGPCIRARLNEYKK